MCLLNITTIIPEYVFWIIGAACAVIGTIIAVLKYRDDIFEPNPNLTKLSTGQTSGKRIQYYVQNTGYTLSSVELTCDDAMRIFIEDEHGSIVSVWEKDQKVFINIEPKAGDRTPLFVPIFK